jgi:hypothetical protein
MSVINTGKTFANGEQLTADKLNQVIDQATFNASEAVDGSTITLISGAMAVNDSGITEAKIENGAVTKAKIENVTDMTVLGNTSGSDAAPQEVAVLDEDDMNSNSDTALATQQSIKAYADSLADITPQSSDDYDQHSIADSGSVNIGGLILKFGNFELANDDAVTLTFPTAFPTACLMVMTQDTRGTGLTGGKGLDVPITAKSATGFTVNRYNEMNAQVGLTFLAIGY